MKEAPDFSVVCQTSMGRNEFSPTCLSQDYTPQKEKNLSTYMQEHTVRWNSLIRMDMHKVSHFQVASAYSVDSIRRHKLILFVIHLGKKKITVTPIQQQTWGVLLCAIQYTSRYSFTCRLAHEVTHTQRAQTGWGQKETLESLLHRLISSYASLVKLTANTKARGPM